MIKAQDLRIDNWVSTDLGYRKIADIQRNRCGSVLKPCRMTLQHFTYDSIKGIELTEDILLKCGFKIFTKDNSFAFYSYLENPCNGDFYFHLKHQIGNENWFFINIGYSFKYVHELQNAIYSLTKTELEINL